MTTTARDDPPFLATATTRVEKHHDHHTSVIVFTLENGRQKPWGFRVEKLFARTDIEPYALDCGVETWTQAGSQLKQQRKKTTRTTSTLVP
jgi:pyruvate-formate lyase